MKLEGEECSITRAPTLASRATRQHQKLLQLRPALLFIAPGLLRQTLGGIRECPWLAPREPLTVGQANFEFDPNRKWVAAERLVVQIGRQFVLYRVNEFRPEGRRFEISI